MLALSRELHSFLVSLFYLCANCHFVSSSEVGPACPRLDGTSCLEGVPASQSVALVIRCIPREDKRESDNRVVPDLPPIPRQVSAGEKRVAGRQGEKPPQTTCYPISLLGTTLSGREK